LVCNGFLLPLPPITFKPFHNAALTLWKPSPHSSGLSLSCQKEF